MSAREPDLRVISIGVLSSHPLRKEAPHTRTGHSTTTLVRSGDRVILVDPGLPAEALVARLGERVGLTPRDITDVFLTSFHPDARRAIEAFDKARWLISAAERESVGVPMASLLRDAQEQGIAGQAREMLLRDVAVLKRCEAAPDELAPGVSLFPMPGVTPGLAGLLVAGRRLTTVVCGDAIPTLEHLAEGKVLPHVADVEKAKESMMEAVEIADLLVLGRDNVVVNPGKRVF